MRYFKWKKAFTAEEAALFAVGSEFRSLEKLTKALNEIEDEYYGENSSGKSMSQEEIESRLRIDFESLEKLMNKLNEDYVNVVGIREAILDEISLLESSNENDAASKTELKLFHRLSNSLALDELNREKSTITKESLAKWFWSRDEEKAKLFDPLVEEKIKLSEIETEASKGKLTKISPKTINSYLKTISALSEALMGGFTDKPYTNAEAVLAALAQKNVESPISKKTLAKYLEDAKDL